MGYDAAFNPLSALTCQISPVNKPPLSPLMGLENYLAAIPIEVKNFSGDPSEARYQQTVFGSVMLRIRQLWATRITKAFDKANPPNVVGLTVTGHTWSFYLLYLGEDNVDAGTGNPRRPYTLDVDGAAYLAMDVTPRVALGPFWAGCASDLLQNVSMLVGFVRVLREWVANECAPEAFGELREPVHVVLDQSTAAASASIANPGDTLASQPILHGTPQLQPGADIEVS